MVIEYLADPFDELTTNELRREIHRSRSYWPCLRMLRLYLVRLLIRYAAVPTA